MPISYLTLLLSLFLFFFSSSNPLTLMAQNEEDSAVKRILIIDSFASADTWTLELKNGLQNSLNDQNIPATFETYELAIRFKPNLVPAPEDISALDVKLKNSKYDLIVLSNNAATNLFLNRQLCVRKETPILVSSYHGSLYDKIPKDLNMGGIETPANPKLNVRLGCQLIPENRKITIITEGTPDGLAQVKLLEDWKNESWAQGLDIQNLNGRDYTTEEMLEYVSKLSPKSFLIYHSWGSTKDKTPPSYNSILPRIRKKYKGIILGRYAEYIKLGSTGGVVVSGYKQGYLTGTTAQKIFAAAGNARSIKTPHAPVHTILDYPTLRRQGINLKNIPPGTELLNQPAGFATQHQTEIIAGLSLALLLLCGYLIRLMNQLNVKKKMGALFGNLPLRIVVVNRSGKVLYYHIPSQDVFAGIIHYRHIDQLPEQIKANFVHAIETVFVTGRKMEQDYDFGEQKRHVEFVPLLENSPFSEKAVMWISSDLTELHQTHQTVSRLAEQFRLTLESIGDGVVATDEQERVVLLNPIASKMTGYTQEEARGKPLAEIFNIVSYIDGKRVESPLKKALQTGHIVELANHTDLIAKDGSARHIADSAAPIRDPDGKIIGGVLVFRDVTDEYIKRDRLRNTNVLLTTAAKIAEFFYFQCDRDGLLSSVSDQSYWPPPVSGVKLEHWITRTETASFEEAWQAFLTGNAQTVTLLFSSHLNDRIFHFELRAEKSVNEINGNWEICGIIQDTTVWSNQQNELLKTIEKAQVAEQAKSYFLATVSHELRTPLNAVIGFSELLQDGTISRSEQLEYLNSINYAGNTLLKLVNDVLDLSRLEADKTHIIKEPVSLSELLSEVTGVFKLKALEKNISLETVEENIPPTLILDNLRFRQILLNLTGNAIKFTHEGGVRIETVFEAVPGETNGVLTLRVVDTGIGICEENLNQIFDAFTQDNVTRGNRVYEGSGLGLAICKRLVEKMGGEIFAESKPGKGSIFSIRFEQVSYNLDAPRGAPEETSHLEHDNQNSQKAFRALIVDDVVMNLKVLQAILKKLNVNCIPANSAVEALTILENDLRFDIILTDLWMPCMSGSEFAQKLKQNPRTASIPVIAITADTQISDQDTEIFDSILTKPITESALRRILNIFKKNQLLEI